jgi:subtilisin-like proprotein convertase family protein
MKSFYLAHRATYIAPLFLSICLCLGPGCTSTFAQATFSATSLPAVIPDPGNVSRTITVSGLSGTVATADEVQVNFNIAHDWLGDIEVGVTPPGGTEIVIVRKIGTSCYSNSDLVAGNTISIRQNAAGFIPNAQSIVVPAGTYLPTGCPPTYPVGSLASLVGASRNGDWTIRVSDLEAIIAGTLYSASITFYNVCVATPTVSIVAAPGNSITAGIPVTFTATPANGGATPAYQWKKNNVSVGTNSPTYMDNTLATGDVITVIMTSSEPCANLATATSNAITMTVCPLLNISVSNISACDGNNTTCTTDDTYTADVTVTYTSKPGSGTLYLTGAQIVGVPPFGNVGSIGATSQTFTGVIFRADGAAIGLTGTFSALPGCTLTNANAGTAPASCSDSPCSITNITLNDAGGCINPGNTTTAADDYFTSTVTVTFARAPGIGNLTLKRGATALATKLASQLSCVNTWTFSNVQMAADNAGVVLTAEFTGCNYTSGTLMTAPAPCSCVSPGFTTCPTAQSVNTTDNQCTASLIYSAAATGTPDPTYAYEFIGATTNSGFGTGSSATFNKGLTNVKITATNDCSSTTCQFTVTVLDNQPPILICPSPMTVSNTPGQCGRTVGYGHTLSDNCGAPTLTYSMSGVLTGNGSGSGSSTYFPVGTTTVVLTATDGANAPVQCTFTVKVNDTEAPNITCPGSILVSNDAGQCGAAVAYKNPVTSDNCGSAGLDHISGSLSGSFFPTGTTTVQWMATDAANNTKTCTFDITVSDTQPPSITCPAQQTRNADPGVCTALTTYPAPTVSDNCTATSPTVAYSFSGATLTPGYLAGTGSGSAFNKGITTVALRATDQNGLTRSCTFRVIVTDAQPPLITCPANQSVNTAATSCTSAPVTYATPTATDNCAPAPTLTRTSGPASGSTFPAGTTNVVWRATDASGRTATCSFSVTVTDNTPPVITCPESVSVSGAAAPCMVNVTYAPPTVSDNCGTPTVFLQSGLLSGSNFPAGTTVNVFRATDARGTTATCSFSVTVSCSGAADKGAADRGATQDAGTILDFSLSPNPAHQQVLVSLTALLETTGEMQLLVFDAQGRLYQQQALTAGTQSMLLPVEAWPSGLYWISVQADDTKVTKRLVVQRL